MSKERFHEIVKEMVEIHDKKNKDYAGDEYLSNFLMCEKHMGVPAWVGCIIRLSDKMARLMNIARTEEVAVSDESVTDTLTDLAVYAIITRILYEDFKRCNI
jgi:kynureninase